MLDCRPGLSHWLDTDQATGSQHDDLEQLGTRDQLKAGLVQARLASTASEDTHARLKVGLVQAPTSHGVRDHVKLLVSETLSTDFTKKPEAATLLLRSVNVLSLSRPLKFGQFRNSIRKNKPGRSHALQVMDLNSIR